jgi:vitamin B12 transporter
MHRNKWKMIVAAGVTVMLLTGPAAAETVKTQDVVVTATRTETDPGKIGGTSLSVVTAADIAAKQLLTVEEVIKTVPGLDIVGSGGAGAASSVFLRGADAKNTLVLIDGIMVNDPASPNRGADLANLTADNIERIEVVRGPISTLYGSNATAGVVNIITKPGSGKPRVYASGEGGSYNTWKLAAGSDGATGRINYSINAARTETDGFSAANADNDRIPQNGNTDEDDGWENTTVSGKLGVDITDQLDLNAVFRWIDSTVDTDDYSFSGYAGDRFDFVGFSQVPAPNGRKEARQDTEQAFGKLDLGFHLMDDALNGRLYYQAGDTKREGFDNDGQRNWDYDGQTSEGGFQGDWRIPGVNVLTAGISYWKEEMDSDSSGIEGVDADLTSYWLQDQVTLAWGLDLVAAVRLDDHKTFGNETTWRIAPAYTIAASGTLLKASYGTGFRAPSLFELFSVYGNTELEAETSRGWDAGIEQPLADGTARIGLAYFDMVFEDRIAWDPNRIIPGAAFPGGYNQLEGDTTTKGVEAFLTWSPVPVVDLILNYTYTDTEDPDGQPLVRRPENKVAFTARYRFLEKGLVNLDLLWVDDRPAITSAADADGNPVETLDAYTVVNLAARYNLTDTFQIFGRIDNVLDENYEEAWSYATPGLSAYAGVKVTF